MVILVTGGAGYIGSHTCVQLLKSGYDVIIVDNLCNSDVSIISKIEHLGEKDVIFYEYDLCDKEKLAEIFTNENIDAVIHFAGLKAVGESVIEPLLYYNNNIKSTLNLLDLMEKYHVRKLVFSSSATVYGEPEVVPISEQFPLSATNPYGRTKLIQEQLLSDLYKADERWNFTVLRYFNPVGGHESGTLRENPKGIPNNLMPYIIQVAEGKREHLNIFGNDYPTQDGTGIRDYIHVMDLADGHIAAIRGLEKGTSLRVYNLGTGVGYSVMQMVKAFEKVNNVEIPYVITKRRAGDIAMCYADTKKAERELRWRAVKTLEEMCRI